MPTTLGNLTLAIYLAALGLYLWNLYGSRAVVGALATSSLAGALVMHYFTLVERSRPEGAVPYHDLYGSMSLLAWMLAFTYLLVERVHGQRSVGPFVVPFAAGLFFLAGLFAPDEVMRLAPARGPLFAFHVTLAILSYAAFALAFVMSLIYLLQSRLLRARRLSDVFWRFPALEVLEQMSRTSVVVGVGALGTAMVIGAIWAHRAHGSYWSADAKEIISVLIVALYGAYLWLGRRTAWRGARAAAVCALNFLVVLFSYTVVNFYLTDYHRFF